jgi:hypothetical protein
MLDAGSSVLECKPDGRAMAEKIALHPKAEDDCFRHSYRAITAVSLRLCIRNLRSSAYSAMANIQSQRLWSRSDEMDLSALTARIHGSPAVLEKAQLILSGVRLTWRWLASE